MNRKMLFAAAFACVSSSAFAAADITAGYVSKVNGSNLQVDMIFVNRGPDLAQRVAYRANLAKGLAGVKCEVGHSKNSSPLPNAGMSATCSAATGVVAIKAGPTQLVDDEAIGVRCYVACTQSMELSNMAMTALNAGKNSDGVDRPNSAKLTHTYNICN